MKRNIGQRSKKAKTAVELLEEKATAEKAKKQKEKTTADKKTTVKGGDK